jgi:hypothetical protein
LIALRQADSFIILPYKLLSRKLPAGIFYPAPVEPRIFIAAAVI